MNLRMLHEVSSLETADVHAPDGKRRRDAWLLPGGILVQIAGALRWWWLALRGGFRGVVIRHRGESRAPLVLIDWETYSRMVVGLRPEVLKSIDVTIDVEEDGGAYS